MIKTVFSAGLAMTIGSGALSYDYAQQAAKNPEQVLLLEDYVAALKVRSVNLMEKEKGPRIASLPQISKGMTTSKRMTTASFDSPQLTNAQQIDDFVKDSPQLQAMVKADRAKAKETWWGRIRHKISGEDAEPRTDRLAGIRDRNFPKPRIGIDPASLSGMSAAELYANRAAISEGLSATAANNMNAVVADMEAMGVDMSVYSLD